MLGCAMIDAAHLRSLDCRGRLLRLGGETVIMGILNVTPDSFSDGGRFDRLEAAVAHGERMVEEGAGMIDVGGQSTRPGFAEVPDDEEIARVVPVIEALVARVSVPISIDTYKPRVAAAALKAGAHLLNDVHGLLRDEGMARLAAEWGIPVVAMHWDPDFKEASGDTLGRMRRFFDRTVVVAERNGIPPRRLILDPGIGFSKTQAQNLELVARLAEVRAWGFPVLLGASRKSFIGNVLSLPHAADRLEGTLAVTALAAWQGVEIIRVHDVAANLRAARMSDALRSSSP